MGSGHCLVAVHKLLTDARMLVKFWYRKGQKRMGLIGTVARKLPHCQLGFSMETDEGFERDKKSDSEDGRSDIHELISATGVCRMLGISKSTYANWRNPKSVYFKSDFPGCVKFKGSSRAEYRKIDVIEFIAKNKK